MHLKSKYYIVTFYLGLILLFSCSDSNKDDREPGKEDNGNGGTTDYVAPTYADDYSSIADWTSRNKWNLANVHDPSVAKCGDYYYMYSTDASYGNAHEGKGHFLTRRSKDLVNWEFIGMAMSQTPKWVKEELNSIRASYGLSPIDSPIYGHWAPVVRKINDNKYRLYYSIVIDNYIRTGLPNAFENFDNSWTERAFIGMMETDDLSSNRWEDKGMVVSSVSDRGDNWYRPNTNTWNGYFKWNAIDPSLVITSAGEHLLVYGSWHSGIVALKLNPETGKPDKLESIEDYGQLIVRRDKNNSNRWQAQEAPEIIYNKETGYYYLFLAYDELSVAYNTRVCRSKNILGPYLGYNGENITEGAECFPIVTHPYKFANHSGWVGISHCAVFQDPVTSQWYYASQGRLPENTNGNPYSNAIMMGHVRAIEWTKDGWPVVMPERYANVPQDEIKEKDLVGRWENIFLNYNYRDLQTSSIVTLKENGKAEGAIKGNWSYDAANKILTIGEYSLIVRRELNWEANPRVPTIIYAGYTNTGVSIWGKQVN